LAPRYLSNRRDLNALVTGVRLTREIGQASALSPWRGEELSPGPAVSNDESAPAFIPAGLQPRYHYVGTCRIGTDEMADAGTDLRVRGVSGLRIADASLISVGSLRQH
jgi:choline dehydrogenase